MPICISPIFSFVRFHQFYWVNRKDFPWHHRCLFIYLSKHWSNLTLNTIIFVFAYYIFARQICLDQGGININTEKVLDSKISLLVKTFFSHSFKQHLLASCYCSVTKSCPTLCNSTGYNPPGSSVQGIFQARILVWVIMSYSGGSSQTRNRTHISCIGRGFFTIERPGKPHLLATYDKKRGGFPDGSDGKESACNVGDLASIPESGRSPGEGPGNPFQ